MDIQFLTGASSRHKPTGQSSTKPANPLGFRRRQLRGHHAAEGVPHDRRRLQLQPVEKLVVVKHQVPQVIQRLDGVRVSGCRAGMLRRVNGVGLRQAVQETVPLEAGCAVQEHQRRPLPRYLYPGLYLVTPNAQGAVRVSSPCYIPSGHRLGWAKRSLGRPTAAFPRSFSGHQWFSQPSSSQMSRSLGRTSFPNRSMFFRVSSWGMEPMCSSTIRLPTRSFLMASSNWSTTDAGLPPITSWLSMKSW